MRYRPQEERLEKFFQRISKYEILSPDEETALFKIIHGKPLSSSREQELIENIRNSEKYKDIFTTIIDAKKANTTIRNDLSNTLNGNIQDSTKDKKTIITKQQAIDVITNCNLRFVVSVAKQYKNRPGASMPDMVGEGSFGLIKAVNRFDETRGFKFISYAVWWIRQAVLQSISENSAIRIPENEKALMRKVSKYIEKFLQENGFPPPDEDIKKKFDLTDAHYYDLMGSTQKISHLDAHFGGGDDDEGTLLDIIPSDTKSTDYDIIRKTDKSAILWILEHRLEDETTYREALACALSYGYDPKGVNPDGKEHTNEEISEEFAKKGEYRTASSIGRTLDRVRGKFKEMITSDGQITEKYKRKFEEEHAIYLQISNIIRNTPIEKRTRALNQLINKQQTKNQALVLSLYSGIPSEINLDGKRYTIKKISQKFKRKGASIRRTLGSAIEKFIDELKKYPSQPEIVHEQGQDISNGKNDRKGGSSQDKTFLGTIKDIPKLGNNFPVNKIVTESRDPSDIRYRKEMVIRALEVLKQENGEGKKDWPKALCLYYGLNPDGIVYDGELFAKKLNRKYYKPAMKILRSAEERIASILKKDLSEMKKILENIRDSNRMAISNVLNDVYTKNIDFSDTNSRRFLIEQALASLEGREQIDNRYEVFRLSTGLNSDGSVGEVHKNEDITKIMGKRSGSSISQLLKFAKRDIATELGMGLVDLEGILKCLKKSNEKAVSDVLEGQQKSTENS